MSIPVVVIGAGVVGLTTALQLKRENSAYDITIVGTFLPGDISLFYTSPFAGANWHSFASVEDKYLQELDTVGYHELMRLADDPQSGIWRKPNASYYTPQALEEVNGDVSKFNDWFDAMTNTRILPKDELRPGTVFGKESEGLVLSVPVYLTYLLQKCLASGIVVKRVPQITHIDHARTLHSSSSSAKLVINCAGLTATKIGGFTDPKRTFPVRGQVMVVRNTVDKVIMVEGFKEQNESLYIMPRKEGGAIIGGSFHADIWDGTEDLGMTQRIVKRALKYAPELVDPSFKGNPDYLDIVRVNVGLRPFREGGVRIEIDPSKKWLIHNYGAGGGGYQGSYGFAQRVCELAREALSTSKL
ncbi:putative D-amino-acid oxidase [Clavispora lusitaniae]|uniref:D-amino-acid oxidase n=2 Tax=Clavispora lusitaniae TaxID=36911 RepID=A0AA91SZW8_CLALS|nr:hypothetical protein E0198_000991 [Clavispora lusitaniae]KAF7584035.1 FAD dependent oxidoreductase family protein [Clavispora lusitaniae]OVF06529.1 putative D-amino-acid oxidase [Clavispora lusitaniae]QFZ25030.1 putative D-amino-acid oxidase [Clavispora lusitaniae]QFZ31667.1 putative D-amino-acid oxidase [Clavispora lusitaniae]